MLISAFKSVPSKTVAWGMSPVLIKQVKEVHTWNLCVVCISKVKRNLEPTGLFPYFKNKETEQFKSEVK